MTTQTTARHDPMKEVMPYDLLKVAANLLVRGQNQRYWVACPTPKNPIGRIRFERTRQVATFLVPLLAWVTSTVVFGAKGLVLGAVGAGLLGYLLDKNLERAIHKKWLRDTDIDSGRYEAVKWLANQMGIAREDITLEVIYKMAADYRVEESKRRDEAERVKAAQKASRVAAATRPTRRRNNERFGGRGAPVVAAGAAEPYAYEDDNTAANAGGVHMPMVNPTTGAPMFPGTFVDTSGTVFGHEAL